MRAPRGGLGAAARTPAKAARAALLAVSLLAITGLLGACGPPPPQAAAPTANRVAEALSGIAQACGEHAQLTGPAAFGAAPAREASVLAAARMRASELAGAVAENPSWIYQGKTLAEVRTLAAVQLRECGLSAAVPSLGRRRG